MNTKSNEAALAAPKEAGDDDTLATLVRLARHADDCLSHRALDTGAGYWHCDCGYDRLILDGRLAAPSKEAGRCDGNHAQVVPCADPNCWQGADATRPNANPPGDQRQEGVEPFDSNQVRGILKQEFDDHFVDVDDLLPTGHMDKLVRGIKNLREFMSTPEPASPPPETAAAVDPVREALRAIVAYNTPLPAGLLEQARAALASPTGVDAAIKVPPGLAAALRSQRQCDEDGVECIVSRQAADEAADIIDALAARDGGSNA